MKVPPTVANRGRTKSDPKKNDGAESQFPSIPDSLLSSVLFP